MRTTNLFCALGLGLAFILSGCGGDVPEKPKEPEKETPKLIISPPSDEVPPEFKQPGKGLGLSKSTIVKGLDPDLPVEDADIATKEGNTFMGHTADFSSAMDRPETAAQAANVVLYGSLAEIRHAYYSCGMNLLNNPDSKDYPEYMKRNQRLAETFLGNILGVPLPADVKAGLEYAKGNPDRDKFVKAGGKIVQFNYSSREKQLKIDVK
jgi:hypothetical protein